MINRTDQPVLAQAMRSDIIVSFINANDGYGERYNPHDKEDVNFLRFTLARMHKGRIVHFPEFSRATLVPAHTDQHTLDLLLDVLLTRLLPFVDGHVPPLEDACDDAAWVDPTWADRPLKLSLDLAALETPETTAA